MASGIAGWWTRQGIAAALFALALGVLVWSTAAQAEGSLADELAGAFSSDAPEAEAKGESEQPAKPEASKEEASAKKSDTKKPTDECVSDSCDGDDKDGDGDDDDDDDSERVKPASVAPAKAEQAAATAPKAEAGTAGEGSAAEGEDDPQALLASGLPIGLAQGGDGILGPLRLQYATSFNFGTDGFIALAPEAGNVVEELNAGTFVDNEILDRRDRLPIVASIRTGLQYNAGKYLPLSLTYGFQTSALGQLPGGSQSRFFGSDIALSGTFTKWSTKLGKSSRLLLFPGLSLSPSISRSERKVSQRLFDGRASFAATALLPKNWTATIAPNFRYFVHEYASINVEEDSTTDVIGQSANNGQLNPQYNIATNFSVGKTFGTPGTKGSTNVSTSYGLMRTRTYQNNAGDAFWRRDQGSFGLSASMFFSPKLSLGAYYSYANSVLDSNDDLRNPFWYSGAPTTDAIDGQDNVRDGRGLQNVGISVSGLFN